MFLFNSMSLALTDGVLCLVVALQLVMMARQRRMSARLHLATERLRESTSDLRALAPKHPTRH